MVRDCFERFAFSFLRALSVTDVQKRQLVVLLASDRRRDAGVHAAGDETDRKSRSFAVFFFDNFSRDLFRTAHQTPFTSGPQMYLCSCNCMRTFKPLAAIQFASCCKSICS